MSFHYFLLLLLLIPPSFARKLLHHPFFPLTSSQSPSQSPTIFPKHPFSTNQNPFFPSNPTPPPPPYHSLSSLPTFPANISSLITPSHSSTTKLLKAIFFPIVSLLILSLFLLFIFFYRRKRQDFAGEDTDNDRLFPVNSVASDSSKPVQSSEFLYLGTLVSSRGQEGSCSTALAPASSPELRPLPPLEGRVRRSSSEEEFYSPSGSDDLKRADTKRLDFYVSTLSSPTYASSNVASSSSPSSSPGVVVFRPPPPPVPPKRKVCCSSSSLKKVTDLLSRENIGEFERKDFVVVPPLPPPLLGQRANGFDGMERRVEIVKPKLKPLHWDKVKASSDRAMVWDQMKSSSFQ